MDEENEDMRVFRGNEEEADVDLKKTQSDENKLFSKACAFSQLNHPLPPPPTPPQDPAYENEPNVLRNVNRSCSADAAFRNPSQCLLQNSGGKVLKGQLLTSLYKKGVKLY